MSDDRRDWVVSSYTGEKGDCVAVNRTGARVRIRDTKAFDDGEISISTAGFSALLDHLTATPPEAELP